MSMPLSAVVYVLVVIAVLAGFALLDRYHPKK